MSWPVKSGYTDTVVAVVNVDSSYAEVFDSDTDRSRREHALNVCGPAINGIAIALLSAEVLKASRT